MLVEKPSSDESLPDIPLCTSCGENEASEKKDFIFCLDCDLDEEVPKEEEE